MPSNVLDYTLDDPDRDAAVGDRTVGMHLADTVRTDRPLPQLVLVDVSRVGTDVGWAGDGSGPVTRFDGRVDAQFHVGTDDDVPGGEAPALLASALAREATAICRGAHDGISDPATNLELAYRVTVLNGPVDRSGLEDPDSHRGDVEIGYNTLRLTPDR
jgi:hypothetical protein